MGSKSVAEKIVVCSTEDVVHAFMAKLLFRCLHRISATTPLSVDQHKAVATQMHAVVLLYNYYQRKQRPDLKFLDLASFCKLAVELKPSLAAFMNVTRQTKLLNLNAQFSLTEKAMKNACEIAAALDASLEVPNVQAWPISRVAVMLIDSSKENCKLQFGAVTEGVWSMFEKELDEVPVGKLSGDKRKRDGLNTGKENLQICYDIVKEITGTESDELVVLGSDITYSLKEEKSAIQFYLVQVPGNGTISPKEQIPLHLLLEKFEGPLVENDFGLCSPREVVSYYHMLPYVEFISRWNSRKDLCLPTIHSGFPQSNSKSCSNLVVSTNPIKDTGHTDNDRFEKTGKKCKGSSSKDKSVAVHKPDTTKKNSFVNNLVKHMNESENGKKIVKEKKSTRLRLPSVKESVNGDQHKVIQSFPTKAAAEIGDTGKLRRNCATVTVFKPTNPKGRSNSPINLLSDKDETEDCLNENSVFCPSSSCELVHSVNGLCHTALSTQNVESVHNAAGCINGKESGESGVGFPAINSADPDQLCLIEGTTKPGYELASSDENALALLYAKREKMFSQMCNMGDTLAQYEDCIERIRDGGDVGLASRCIKSILSGNDNWMLKNEAGKQDKDHESKSQTGKQSSSSRLSVIFGHSKCQLLVDMCRKSNLRLPTYHVEPAEGKFRSDVVVAIKDSKVTSKGGLRSSPSEARESAAAQMIDKYML